MIRAWIIALAAAIISVLCTDSALAQSDTLTPPLPLKKDTLCAFYKFYPGDTLVYNLAAYDSIQVNYYDFLWKQRNEQWTVVCDSVKNDTMFYLSLSLTGFYSKEFQKNNRDQIRTTCPWLGRKVTLVIDQIGNRLDYALTDSTHPAMNPGGPFQPSLFFPFGSRCNEKGKTTITEFTGVFPENGLPTPVIAQKFISKPERVLDTLGYSCVHILTAVTSQGSIRVSNIQDDSEIMYRTTSIQNGHTSLDISIDYHVPVHFFSTEEQKLTLHFGNNKKQPGVHYINTFCSLSEFRQSPLRKQD